MCRKPDAVAKQSFCSQLVTSLEQDPIATSATVDAYWSPNGVVQELDFTAGHVFTSPITYAVLFSIRREALSPVFIQLGIATALRFIVVFQAIYSPVSKVLRQESADSLRYE